MAVPYYGDFSEDATVYIPFNTFDSNDPSASVTVTDLADADIKVHKDGSVTQIVTDGATVAINFDSITGNHLITIDTSVHADYAVGSDYLVRLEGITVDAATLNVWVGSFSIENRHGSTTANTILTDTEAVLTDSEAVLTDTEASQTTEAAVLTDTEAAITERSTLLTDTEAILADSETIGTPIDFGSGVSTIAANLQDMADNGTAVFDRSTDSLQAMRDAVITDTEAILVDSEAIIVDTEAVLTDSEAILTDTGTTLDNHLTDIKGTGFVKDTDSLTNVLTDSEAILTDSEAVLADTEAAGPVLTDTEAILTDTEAVLTDSEAILADSEAVIADTENLNLGIIYGTAQTGTLSTTQATTDLTGYVNDELIGRVIVWTGGTADGQATDITDYASASGLITFTAMTTAPANGDTFKIV